ncbi:sarcosine oxidase subunit delta [Phaeobacter marinintestinus]|uniref:sarcosine oxidase subunit delta n=1 Tax=Falsiphaeobacter marinintestinus TaxID=1492905 RepID=UPI0011B47921|nr:sarcosine oxidase subunit delta [Phaeobacter marinintestinus]
MRLPCPICGERDRREFYYKGAALERPAPDAGEAAWDDYVYLRENPAGDTRELWYHDGGCGAWLVVTRNTLTHAVIGAELASEAKA